MAYDAKQSEVLTHRKGIHFRVAEHQIRNVQVVEVWHGDKFIATICPPPDVMADIVGVTVISKHVDIQHIRIDQKPPVAVFIPFTVD